MEETPIVSSSNGNVQPSYYNLNKGEGDLQRYFDYKTVKENGRHGYKARLKFFSYQARLENFLPGLTRPKNFFVYLTINFFRYVHRKIFMTLYN